MKRRPTIIDVAQKAGVSKSTVSRVIADGGQGVSGETKSRILEAISELGYVRDVVASSMRTQRTHTIMLAISDITNPFWPAVARGVQDAMDEEGYAVIFANSDWNNQREARFLEMAQRNRLDGLLINPVGVTENELRALGIPTVILGSDPKINLDRVGTDSLQGAKEALAHLFSLGHKHIGLILGIQEGRNRTSRLPLYIDVMKKADVKANMDWIITVPFRQKAGKDAMHKFMIQRERPTAVFCENDLLAIGAIEAVRELGFSVPDDVSVVGVDDIFAASITTPPLTTVAKPKYERGVQAARLLLERMNSDSDEYSRTITIASKLIVRGSTGPPKQAR